jgi:hypothetical protein
MLRNIFILVSCLLILFNCQISTILDYTTQPGIQLYLKNESEAFFYVSLSGDTNNITITGNLYLAATQDTITSSSGVYCSIGFASNKMEALDLAMFFYNKGKFSCGDYYYSGNNGVPDISKGGRNDISFVSGNISTLAAAFSPYTTLITWTCTKDISNVDSYDWSDFKNWQTNKGTVAGAWSYLDSRGIPLQHEETPVTFNIVDGSGIQSTSDPTINSNSANFIYINICLLIILSIFI